MIAGVPSQTAAEAIVVKLGARKREKGRGPRTVGDAPLRYGREKEKLTAGPKATVQQRNKRSFLFCEVHEHLLILFVIFCFVGWGVPVFSR